MADIAGGPYGVKDYFTIKGTKYLFPPPASIPPSWLCKNPLNRAV